MVGLTVDTGDLLDWAKKMEDKGADFGAAVMKQVKSHHEGQRRQRLRKFAKIKRRKQGTKRFVIQKSPDKAALDPTEGLKRQFNDIFDEA
jgi:hypothetical protein